MPSYLCLQRKLGGGGASMPSPSQMQEMFSKFSEWKERFQGNIVDLGGKLGAGELVTAQPTVDGPLVEVKELVGGFMILSADSLAQAVEIAEQLPGLVRPGSGVEVIEIKTP